MTIIVGASKPNKFKIGAAGIMWWEETPASHVYTQINVLGDEMVFQAVGSGTQLVPLHRFLQHNIPVYKKQLQITPEQFNKVARFMNSKLGTKYSQKHLLGLFYKRTIQYVFKKIIANPFKDKGGSEVCVECQAQVVDMAEIKRNAEDAEDMGIFEALKMLKLLPGEELKL